MEADDRYIIVFASHSQATYLFNELNKKNIKIEFVSTPSKILSGCSKAIIFNFSDTKLVVEEVKKIKAVVRGIYRIVISGGDYDYIQVV